LQLEARRIQGIGYKQAQHSTLARKLTRSKETIALLYIVINSYVNELNDQSFKDVKITLSHFYKPYKVIQIDGILFNEINR
jgi:hypothetical protein